LYFKHHGMFSTKKIKKVIIMLYSRTVTKLRIRSLFLQSYEVFSSSYMIRHKTGLTLYVSYFWSNRQTISELRSYLIRHSVVPVSYITSGEKNIYGKWNY